MTVVAKITGPTVRIRIALGVCAVLAGSAAAVPAVADPIPGAAYHGIAADGADVALTLSPDGTLVDSYHLTGVQVGQCMMTAAGQKGSFEGAPVVGNGFTYTLGDAIDMRGTFSGAQSVSGTFRLTSPGSSTSPPCDTGTVSWTATTSAAPSAGDGSASGGSGSGAAGGGSGTGGSSGTRSGPGSGGRHRFPTRVTLRRLAARRLGGTVTSPTGGCRGGRTVVLWRGAQPTVRSRTRRDGAFTFPGHPGLRGRRFRATVLSRRTAAGICTPGSSIFIRT